MNRDRYQDSEKKKKGRIRETHYRDKRIIIVIALIRWPTASSLDYIIHAPTWLSPMRLARPTRALDIALYVRRCA